MLRNISPDHPKQKLLFFVVQEIDDSIRSLTGDFVCGLRLSREWLCGPPEFIDYMQAPGELSKGDIPIEALGGYLEVYTVMRPWTLPRDVDIRLLNEVEYLAQALCAFSVSHKLEFELQLDRVFIGAIENGQMDECLTVGLLGEWRRHLESAQ